MGYLYETHLHTCLASACGISTGKEHVRYYKDLGFTGIMMTDHFLRRKHPNPEESSVGRTYRPLLQGI